MSGSNIAARIADWVAQVRYEDVPRRVLEEAKNQILSVIASVHAGHFSEAGRIVARTVKQWAGDKESTLIPSGERASVHTAIFGNAALSMALDYDDYQFGAHTGHSSVLVAIALAEKLGTGGREMLLAQVVANEVAGRVGAATLLGPLQGQRASFLHLIGGAMVAAKLLKLERPQIEHAIGIALLQPTFSLQPGFFGSDAKTLLAAMTAPTGVQAAELAANGLRGAADIFEGDHGFLQTFTPHPLPGAFEGLGKVWLTETLCYKLYPGCAYIATFSDCVLALARQHQIDTRAVRAIHIAATPLTLNMEALAAPYVKGPESYPTTLNFCVGYNAAVALMDRELTARQFTRERIKDPAVWDLAGKVTLTRDEEMTRRWHERSLPKGMSEQGQEVAPLDLGKLDVSRFVTSMGARVRIEMTDGRSFDMEQEVPFGASGRPFEERRRAVEDKFRRETRYTLRKERMERAIDLTYHLDSSAGSHIRELVRTGCSEKA